jgi:Fe2+ or Zn2+ uptake regulation protein
MLIPLDQTMERELTMDDSTHPDMVSRLRDSGKRITPERELLLRIVENHAHLDAEEIYRIAQKDRPQIGMATVYRTLTLLKEMDIIRASDLGENHEHYEVRSEDHVHLVCSICGRVTDVPVPSALYKAARKEQFTVQRAHFEIFGTCQSCTDTQAASSEGSRG